MKNKYKFVGGGTCYYNNKNFNVFLTLSDVL